MKGDPRLQPWTGIHLFLHPRHDMLRDTIEQILLDNARGILVPPVWKNSPNFFESGRDRGGMVHRPPERPIYTGAKPSWTTRNVLFDAIAALDADAGMDECAGMREDEFFVQFPFSAPPPPLRFQ